MKCIYCKNPETSVNNSRKTNNGLYVWRRRECAKCSTVFTTTESPFADNIFVIKRSGKRQRFIYEKLLVSIAYSLEQGKSRDHGTEALSAKKITNQIIEDVLQSGKKDTSTAFLIMSAYTHLKEVSVFSADRYMYYSEFRLKLYSSLKAAKK
jgi:transcriptional repressor NrdR